MHRANGGRATGEASVRPERPTASMRTRLRYRFETRMSKSLTPIVLSLAALPLLFGLIGGAILTLTNTHVPGVGNLGFVEATWMSVLRAMDPGTMGQDVGWPLRSVSLFVTVVGIVVLTVVIGLVSNAISERIEDLRKGRSTVVETGHTLILGWSPKIFAVLTEIVTANSNHKDRSIVVMAPRDKVAMEDEIRSRVPALGPTRIVCRTGNPAQLEDLSIVHPEAARSIVLVAPCEGGDAHVIRTALALTNRWPNIASGVVVAELADLRNAEALRDATGDKVTTVASAHVIGQITAQVCRQAGLGVVYQELLDFDGDEIYFQHEPTLVGRTFGQALLSYDTSSVIGLRRADGRIELNPPVASTIEPGDAVIAISADDHQVVLGDLPGDDVAPRCRSARSPASPREHILFVGWNELGPMIVRELDDHVGEGSCVDIVVDPELIDVTALTRPLKDGDVRNFAVRTHEARVREPARLEDRLLAKHYDRVVVLCYEQLAPAEADALALLALVQIRQLRQRHSILRDGHTTTVVQLLDPGDVELARLSGADDFIVSDRLTSLMLSQLAENPELDRVFRELFDAEGSVICCNPGRLYTRLEASSLWSDVVRAAARRGEVAIGYRSPHGASTAASVSMNPPKSQALALGAADEVIVIANRPRQSRPAAIATAGITS